VRDFGIVGDDADTLRAALRAAAVECDAVITSGGVSMGDYDLVKQVLTESASVELWKVAMQPAKPFAFGSIGRHAAVRAAGESGLGAGGLREFRPSGTAFDARGHAAVSAAHQLVWAERVETDPAKTVFLRVVRDGESVRLAGGQDSNVLSATANADALAVVDVGIASWNRDVRTDPRVPSSRYPHREEVLG
jgi:molybdopterin molybdotransferase